MADHRSEREVFWGIEAGLDLSFWDEGDPPVVFGGAVYSPDNFGKWCFDWVNTMWGGSLGRMVRVERFFLGMVTLNSAAGGYWDLDNYPHHCRDCSKDLAATAEALRVRLGTIIRHCDSVASESSRYEGAGRQYAARFLVELLSDAGLWRVVSQLLKDIKTWSNTLFLTQETPSTDDCLSRSSGRSLRR